MVEINLLDCSAVVYGSRLGEEDRPQGEQGKVLLTGEQLEYVMLCLGRQGS